MQVIILLLERTLGWQMKAWPQAWLYNLNCPSRTESDSIHQAQVQWAQPTSTFSSGGRGFYQHRAPWLEVLVSYRSSQHLILQCACCLLRCNPPSWPWSTLYTLPGRRERAWEVDFTTSWQGLPVWKGGQWHDICVLPKWSRVTTMGEVRSTQVEECLPCVFPWP